MADVATDSPGSERTESVSAAAPPLDIDRQVAFAKQELAVRLGIDTADIEVTTVRTVQWRSGAAGCPQPGMNYTMAIVPGVLILLEVGDDAYRYHAGVGREPFFCPAELAEAPAFGQGEEAM